MIGSQQQHFLMSVALMLFFFIVATVEQLLFALHVTGTLVGAGEADRMYVLFGGIVMGMMRGMWPDPNGK